MEGDLKGDLTGDYKGDFRGDFRGDFAQDLEGDLLSCQAQVSLGPCQVWLILAFKYIVVKFLALRVLYIKKAQQNFIVKLRFRSRSLWHWTTI